MFSFDLLQYFVDLNPALRFARGGQWTLIAKSALEWQKPFALTLFKRGLSLSEYVDADLRNTLFHFAAFCAGDPSLLQHVSQCWKSLSEGEKRNASNVFGLTPAHYAAISLATQGALLYNFQTNYVSSYEFLHSPTTCMTRRYLWFYSARIHSFGTRI